MRKNVSSKIIDRSMIGANGAHTEKQTASYDLHLHTYWSYDATADIESYFRQARDLGMRCIAITEHHNLDSAEEIADVAARYPEVQLIVAAELSVTTSIGSVDLLCYNLPRQPYGLLAQVLDEYQEWQHAAGAWVSSSMQALGYNYSDAERMEVLQSYRPQRVLARQGATHTWVPAEAKHFMQRGYISAGEDYRALRRLAAKEVKMPPYPAVQRVVQAVKEAGGLVVIAHPTHYFLRNDVMRMDSLRHECRLDGIECSHHSVTLELTEFYRAYCKQHGLVSTAGSDCHHPEHLFPPQEEPGHTGGRQFAHHLGTDDWLDEFLERLVP